MEIAYLNLVGKMAIDEDNVGRAPLDEWSVYRRDLCLKTDIYAPGGIRTLNSSRWEAADPRLWPRGHWDRHISTNSVSKTS